MSDWTEGHGYGDLTNRTLLVDGVAYSVPRVRELLRERHELTEINLRLRLEAGRLRALVGRQEVHLQRRTSALVRLIARKGPRL